MDLLANISIELLAIFVEIVILIPIIGWWIQRGNTKRLRPFLHQVAFELDSRTTLAMKLVIRYVFPEEKYSYIQLTTADEDIDVARSQGQAIKSKYSSSAFALPKKAISEWTEMSENINLITILAEFHQKKIDLNSFAYDRVSETMVKSTIHTIRKVIKNLSPNYKTLNRKNTGQDYFLIDTVDVDRLIEAIEFLKSEVSVVTPRTADKMSNTFHF